MIKITTRDGQSMWIPATAIQVVKQDPVGGAVIYTMGRVYSTDETVADLVKRIENEFRPVP